MSFPKGLAIMKMLYHFQGTADAFSHDAKALAVAVEVSMVVSCQLSVEILEN